MDDMTAEQKKLVDEFRRRTINDVTPKMLEDNSLFYRFAKARDFNLVDAEAMLRKHLIWRKEMQIDTILTDYEPPEVLVKYAPSTLVCFDKQGCIVRLVDCGRTDVKGLWNVVHLPDLVKYCAYVIEKDKDIMIKKGRGLGKPMYTPIYDFECLSYANAVSLKALQLLSAILKMFVDNYPETIKRISVINAPCSFTVVFAAMKQVMPKQVINKFRVYGSDGWKEAFLELVDPSVLPAYLGGTKTDPDGNPLCNTFILRGRPIPRCYYKNKGINKSPSAQVIEKLLVKPFSKEEIAFDVRDASSWLEWEIETKGKDIDFLLLFREGPSENCCGSLPLIPKQRIDSNGKTEKGSFKCERAGSYIMVFDNTYSWIHSKEVHYRAEIKSPRKEEKYNMQ